jgi:hypothetical protein
MIKLIFNILAKITCQYSAILPEKPYTKRFLTLFPIP